MMKGMAKNILVVVAGVPLLIGGLIAVAILFTGAFVIVLGRRMFGISPGEKPCA